MYILMKCVSHVMLGDDCDYFTSIQGIIVGLIRKGEKGN